MADVCDKDLYDLKILEAIDYITSVSKKKPTKERILKYIEQFKVVGRSFTDVTW